MMPHDFFSDCDILFVIFLISFWGIFWCLKNSFSVPNKYRNVLSFKVTSLLCLYDRIYPRKMKVLAYYITIFWIYVLAEIFYNIFIMCPIHSIKEHFVIYKCDDSCYVTFSRCLSIHWVIVNVLSVHNLPLPNFCPFFRNVRFLNNNLLNLKILYISKLYLS